MCTRAERVSFTPVELIFRAFRLLLRIHLPFLDGHTEDRTRIPICSDDEVVVVSHIETPQMIYIQKNDSIDCLTAFLTELYEYYSKNGEALSSPRVGELCSVLSEDSNFYRAIAEDVSEPDHVKFRYIDYGNCERVPRANIKRLEAKHLELNEFAIEIVVPLWSNLPNEKVINDIATVTTDCELKLKILEHYKSHWIVDLTTHGFSLIRNMVEKGFAARKDLNEIRAMLDETPLEAPKPPAVKENGVERSPPKSNVSLTAAYIAHADDPSRFYIQLDKDQGAIDQMQANLQIVAQSLPELHEFRVGANCVCKYSADNQWYRARIIDSDGLVTSVQFADFGNTDTITDNAFLKQTLPAFDEIKPYALLCSMPLAPRGKSDWDAEACDKLFAITQDKVHVEFISQGEQISYVKLHAGERDITKELVLEKLAEPLEVIRDGTKCFLSHLNSLDDFYIQLDTDSKKLQLIESFLDDVSKFPPLETLKPGTICIAPYDEGYYRAKIMSVNEANKTADVLFIDYGNTSTTGDLRVLPSNIATLPKLRKNCSLHRPDGIESWSRAAENRFQELTETKVLEVRLVKPGKKAAIEIWLNGANVVDELCELCPKRKLMHSVSDDPDLVIVKKSSNRRKCHVSHVNTPLDFYVQLHDQMSEIDALEEKLNAAHQRGEMAAVNIDSVAVGQHFVAQFPNKGGFYRVKILGKLPNEVRVLLIDYGNQTVTNNIFAMKNELQTPPLALHCTLQTPLRKSLAEDALNKLQQIMSGKVSEAGDNTFQEIEIVSDGSGTGPAAVNLFLSSQDIVRLVGAEATVDQLVDNAVVNAEAEAKNLGAMINEYVNNIFDV